jgi:O-methyltransferase
MTRASRLVMLHEFVPDTGLCWVAPLPPHLPPGDRHHGSEVSSLRLFEDEHELGPAHALHDSIRREGGGRFSHWDNSVFFSTSDGSSPLKNGRRYMALVSDARGGEHARVLESAAQLDPATLDPETRYAWGERLFGLFVADAKLAEFGRSFFLDWEFLADYERFDRQNYRSLDRKYVVRELLKLALRQPGDVAECVVFRGATAFVIAKAMAVSAPEKRLHLFDSFAGLSQPHGPDGQYWEAGALACSLAEVQTNLSTVRDRVIFYPGWIPQRFGDVANVRFCFVHVDVDLHQPTRDALAFFYPRLMPGGVLVCDDYGFETCPGARRAMDEFFATKAEPVLHLPTGQGVVLRTAPLA